MTSNANQKAKTLQLLDANVYCYMINVVHITDDASTEPYELLFNIQSDRLCNTQS